MEGGGNWDQMQEIRKRLPGFAVMTSCSRGDSVTERKGMPQTEFQMEKHGKSLPVKRLD